jgi:hypothetical protein
VVETVAEGLPCKAVVSDPERNCAEPVIRILPAPGSEFNPKDKPPDALRRICSAKVE